MHLTKRRRRRPRSADYSRIIRDLHELQRDIEKHLAFLEEIGYDGEQVVARVLSADSPATELSRPRPRSRPPRRPQRHHQTDKRRHSASFKTVKKKQRRRQIASETKHETMQPPKPIKQTRFKETHEEDPDQRQLVLDVFNYDNRQPILSDSGTIILSVAAGHPAAKQRRHSFPEKEDTSQKDDEKENLRVVKHQPCALPHPRSAPPSLQTSTILSEKDDQTQNLKQTRTHKACKSQTGVHYSSDNVAQTATTRPHKPEGNKSSKRKTSNASLGRGRDHPEPATANDG